MFVNTFTPFTATRSGKKLTAVHKDQDLRWMCADGAGVDTVITGFNVQFPTLGAGLGQSDTGCEVK